MQEDMKECLFCHLIAPKVCEEKKKAEECEEFKCYFEEKTR